VDAIDFIERFFNEKIKIKTKNCIGIWGQFWCCWKALGKSNKIEFILQFLELKCGRYYFLMDFFAINSKKLQILGLEGKISCTLNIFTLLIFLIKSIMKMWKIKNVFMLGQMAQATLVSLIFTNKKERQNTRIIKKIVYTSFLKNVNTINPSKSMTSNLNKTHTLKHVHITQINVQHLLTD
jgi:hypothetical protein